MENVRLLVYQKQRQKCVLPYWAIDSNWNGNSIRVNATAQNLVKYTHRSLSHWQSSLIYRRMEKNSSVRSRTPNALLLNAIQLKWDVWRGLKYFPCVVWEKEVRARVPNNSFLTDATRRKICVFFFSHLLNLVMTNLFFSLS